MGQFSKWTGTGWTESENLSMKKQLHLFHKNFPYMGEKKITDLGRRKSQKKKARIGGNPI